MGQYLRHRFWIEVSLALFAGILALITLLSREWIEVVFHVDPDGGSGSLEWLIVAVLAAAAIVLAVMASGVAKRRHGIPLHDLGQRPPLAKP